MINPDLDRSVATCRSGECSSIVTGGAETQASFTERVQGEGEGAGKQSVQSPGPQPSKEGFLPGKIARTLMVTKEGKKAGFLV